MKSAKSALATAIAAWAIALSAAAVFGQRILTQEEAAKSVAVRNLKVAPTEVSGEVVNNSPHTVRDIEVLIQYHWLWTNEFKPGAESPGQSAVIKLDRQLSPGESAAFRHAPDPPPASRKDGRFEPEVVIVGFTTVIAPTTTSR